MTFTFNPTLSLFIPRILKSTTDTLIKKVFSELGVGIVSRVDFVENEKGNMTAFVHFKEWFNNLTTQHLQERIFLKQQGKIVYNDPYYWIVMENKKPRTEVEVELERRIDHLEEDIKYWAGIVSDHTRKFMDRKIANQTKYCEECYIEMPVESTNCIVCDEEQLTHSEYRQVPDFSESESESEPEPVTEPVPEPEHESQLEQNVPSGWLGSWWS
jgi:hypothetical protein